MSEIELPGYQRRRWKTQKGERGRKEILEAAVECFVEIGYQNTTMSEVAKRAGVARGRIQYHFTTTHHLLVAAVKQMGSEIYRRTAEALARRADNSSDVIRDGVEVMWAQTKDPLEKAWRRLNAIAKTDPGLAAVFAETRAELEQVRETYLRGLYHDLAALDPEAFKLIADYLVTFFDGLAQIEFEKDDEGRKRALVEFMISTIRGFWADHGKDPTQIKPEMVAKRAARLAQLEPTDDDPPQRFNR